MSHPIKILIAEHNAHDIELLHHELKISGIKYVSEVVENERDYVNALREYVPDIILSDYTFPSFDGLTAFKMREEIAPNTPFIIVSGTIGEENSIELIKNGVTDFVVKDRIFTLHTKLIRALKDAKDWHQKDIIEKELKISESRLNQSQAIAKVGSWETDLLTLEVIWSKETFRIFDLDSDSFQISHKKFLKLVHPDDREKVNTAFIRSQDKDTENGIVHRIITPCGIIKIVEECWRIIHDDQGLPIRAIGTCQDITERKNAEDAIIKSNQRYEYVTKATSDAIWDWDIATNKVFWGDGYFHLFGEVNDDESLTDIEKVHKRIHPDDIEKVLTSASLALKEKDFNWSHEHRYLKSDGSYAYVCNKAIVIRDDNGKVIRVIGAMQDITERKKSETLIRESERRYRTLFEQNLAGFYQSTLQGQIINCNEAFAKMLKYDSPQELFKVNANKLYFSPEDRDVFISNIKRQKNLRNYEGVLKCKDGTPLYFLENTSEQTDPVTGQAFFDGILIDISDRKLAEQNIINSEEKRKLIMNSALDAIVCIATSGDITFWNPQAEIIFGWKENEVMGKCLSEIIIPEQYRSRHEKGMANYLKTGTAAIFNKLLEFSAVNRVGEEFPVELTIIPIKQGGEEFFCAFIRDITERKKAEETIQASYNEKNTILESIADAFFAVDMNWTVTYWNKEAETVLQTPKNKIVGHNLWDVFSSSIDSESFRKYHQAIEKNEVIHFEDHFAPLEKWYEVSAYPSATGLSVYFKDITDRKTSEIAIKKAYDEKNLVLESIDDGFFAIDNDSIVKYWNKKAELLLNTKKDDVIGKNLHELFANPASIAFYNQYQKAINEKTTVHFEEFSNRTNKWFSVSAFASDIGLSVYFKDVTDRKNAENAIRLSNERYDLVTKATNDSIWDWDMNTGKTTRTGDGFKTLFGYEIEEAKKVDLFWEKLVHPEDLPRVKEVHTQLFNNPAEFYWEDEYRFMKANGQYAWVYDKGYIIRDENGKAIRMIGATQDITQQKEQVTEIIRIQHNLDALINNTSDQIWSVDNELKIIAANKIYSITIELITGKQVFEGDNAILKEFDAEMTNKWKDLYEKALSGEAFSIEETFYNKVTKETSYSIVSFSPIINVVAKVTGVACYAKDITELKEYGEKLQVLNNTLEQRAEELAASNTELERFAYVTSHDLQEPLRMVSSFLQLLEKKYKEKLDETAEKYIHFAVDGAERMKKLILDLLEYSRVGTNNEVTGDTDMNEVMQEVLFNLHTPIKELEASIEIAQLPVLSNTRKTQMLQLMQNLVSNALKYHDIQKPIIQIGIKEEEKQWLFYVKDNGIGIDPRFADKVFVIFQRLHNKSEYAGTGIGLSICKKIVERHGGKIWVESGSAGGSIFYFTINKNNFNYPGT